MSPANATPTTYALEKAVRTAARRLGRSASAAAIEQEALSLLTEAGWRPTQEPAPEPLAQSTRGASLAPSREEATSRSAPTAHHTIPGHAAPPALRLHLSISAAGCASRRRPTQKARLYETLRSCLLPLAPPLRSATSVHVRDTSSLFIGHPADVLDEVVQTLGHVAADLHLPHIVGPFLDVALPENIPLLERLPQALEGVSSVCPIVQVRTRENGFSHHALSALAYALALVQPRAEPRGMILLTADDCDRRAFGHRVHASSVVAYLRDPLTAPGAAHELPAIPETWTRVPHADLPLSLTRGIGQTTHSQEDRIHPLPVADADAILTLMDDALLNGAAPGMRRHLTLIY